MKPFLRKQPAKPREALRFVIMQRAVLAMLLIGATSCGKDESPRSVATARLTPGTEGAQYIYDGAGNILQINPAPIPAVAIVGFFPTTGGVGEVVTVLGAGFSPTSALNSIDLNGTPAAVLSATPTELSFAVPSGATTGKISVTSGGTTATSTGDFTVVSGTVVVSDFTPKMGYVGTVLTVAGFNFDPNPSGDSVTIGGGTGVVTGADIGYLSAAVASTATSGKVSVTTLVGTGTSQDDFFLLPPNYTEWDIGFAGRAEPGSATTSTISQAGQAALVLFDGTQGDFRSLYVSNITFPGLTTITVYTPAGTSLFSQASIVATQEYKFELLPLPSTGTYTVVIQPAATSVGALDLQVLQDASAVLAAGVVTPIALARGQNGRFTFTAAAGDSLSLACTSSTTNPGGTSVSLSIYRPDGIYIWGGSVVTPTSWQLPQMPVGGTYTILVKPSGTASAAMTFLLSQPNLGTIVVDGDPAQFQNSVAGQAGRYMFAGNAGDVLGLGVSAIATTPANTSVTLSVFKPDGTQLWSSTTSYPNSWQLPQLPVTGTFTLAIQPSGTATASVTFLLSRPITGTLPADGSVVTYQTARVGQAGRYTFAAAAGQRFTLEVTANSTFSGWVNVYQPSGASIASASLNPNSDLKVDLGALPASGTYIVAVTPAVVSTGQVLLRLVTCATDTLTVGDPAKTLTLGTAQNGRYTFTGNAGDFLGLGVTAVSTTPANTIVNLYVYKPDGSALWNSGTSYPTSWQLPQLPTTGTYTLFVQPNGTASASLTFLLSQAITGTLPSDGSAATYQTARVGQAGRYTFAGAAGQQFTLEVTANSTFSGSVYLYQPSGYLLASAPLNPNNDLKLDLGALPASGTYTVTVTPAVVSTGQVLLRLLSYATDTLTIGDPAKTLTLGTAQNGWYPVSGSTGDLLNLVVTALSTTPPGGSVAFSLSKPDGTSLWNGSSYGSATWQVPQLGANGTYLLFMRPSGTASASVAVQFTRR